MSLAPRVFAFQGLRRDRQSLRLRQALWLAILGLALVGLACDDTATETSVSDAVVSPRAVRRLPNLVLITLDTTRADALGSYGQIMPTSPQIDRMAREGVLFERALASSPET